MATTGKYTPWLKSDVGVPYGVLDTHLGFAYTKTLNDVGWFKIMIPADFELAPGVKIETFLAPDRRVEFWRKSGENSEPSLDFVGLLRRWEFSTSAGSSVITLEGPDMTDLIRRRIVAYRAGEQESMTTPSPNDGIFYFPRAITEVAKENFGTDSASGRDLSNWIGIQSGDDDGNGAFRHIAWENLLELFINMNADSRARGHECFWYVAVTGVNANGSLKMDFMATTSSPGSDRRWHAGKGAKPMVFGLRWGNLIDPKLTYDYSNEINFVYAAGAGEAHMRPVAEISDTQRINASVFNRCEAFADARQASTTEDLEGEAYAMLAAGRPKIIFSGTIASTEQTPYGEWGLGTYVSVEYAGKTFDGLVRAVDVSVAGNGADLVQAAVEYVDFI